AAVRVADGEACMRQRLPFYLGAGLAVFAAYMQFLAMGWEPAATAALLAILIGIFAVTGFEAWLHERNCEPEFPEHRGWFDAEEVRAVLGLRAEYRPDLLGVEPATVLRELGLAVPFMQPRLEPGHREDADEDGQERSGGGRLPSHGQELHVRREDRQAGAQIEGKSLSHALLLLRYANRIGRRACDSDFPSIWAHAP